MMGKNFKILFDVISQLHVNNFKARKKIIEKIAWAQKKTFFFSLLSLTLMVEFNTFMCSFYVSQYGTHNTFSQLTFFASLRHTKIHKNWRDHVGSGTLLWNIRSDSRWCHSAYKSQASINDLHRIFWYFTSLFVFHLHSLKIIDPNWCWSSEAML